MRVVERARAAHALLAVPEHALQRERHARGLAAAILHAQRVAGAGHVRVATERREHGAAQEERADGAGKRRQPAERALPGQALGGERLRHAVQPNRRPGQRRSGAADEVRVPGELDGRAGAAVEEAERVQTAVRRMDAGERQPVIAGKLPGDTRWWLGGHEAVLSGR
jgi:hypothetical protein